jgi:hypothetical protein
MRRVNEARVGQHYKDVDAAKNTKARQKNRSYSPTLSLSNLSMARLTKDIGLIREWCYNWKTVSTS